MWLTTAVAATRTLSTGAIAFLAAGLTGLVVWIGMHLWYSAYYEGIAMPWPISIVWDGIDGAIDNAVEEATRTARARCEAEKEASRRAAEERDRREDAEAVQRMTAQLQAARNRELEARNERDEFKRQLDEEDAEDARTAPPAVAGTACPPRSFNVGPRATRGLQRRQLPYPSN